MRSSFRQWKREEIIEIHHSEGADGIASIIQMFGFIGHPPNKLNVVKTARYIRLMNSFLNLIIHLFEQHNNHKEELSLLVIESCMSAYDGLVW